MNKLITLILILFYSIGLANAGVYKYKDQDGVTRYSDVPPFLDGADVTVLKLKNNQLEQKVNDLEGALDEIREDNRDSKQKINDLEEKHKLLEEQNQKQRSIIENQENKIKALNDKDKKAKFESDSKLSGCKLADELRFVSKSKKLEELVKKSADSQSEGALYSNSIDGGFVGSTFNHYVFNPVCQNQTQYTISTDAFGNVVEINKKIVR